MDKILSRGEFDSPKLSALREQLQRQTNENNIEPLSFEIYKKSEEERELIKEFKSKTK
tara:strand:- start:319 stop:492 length:174 start_codon:yes stop_codon:yes gene_type:complete